MRLVTFNIHNGRDIDGHLDLDLLGTTCAALGADVLGLQEVDVGSLRTLLADEVELVAAATGMAPAFGSVRQLPGGGRYGNALFVRGSFSDVEVLELPGLPGRERRCAVLATAVLAQDVRLSVAVCHLDTGGKGSLQLPAVVEALVDRPPPHALLGDLNLAPAEVRPAVAAAGLTLAEDGGDTFPAREPDRRIDHIALGGLVETATVVPFLPLSDHRPLVVEAEPTP